MDVRISDLLKIFQEEINLYRDLIEHERRKTALLVQSPVEALQESNRTDEMHNVRLRALEMKMIGLCQDLCLSFQIPREEFTLMKLANCLDPSLDLEIKTQTRLLRNIVKQFKAISQHNIRLMERSIHYSGGVLALISNALGSYRRTGLFDPIPSVQPAYSQRA
jgi:hypothetical protein